MADGAKIEWTDATCKTYCRRVRILIGIPLFVVVETWRWRRRWGDSWRQSIRVTIAMARYRMFWRWRLHK